MNDTQRLFVVDGVRTEAFKKIDFTRKPAHTWLMAYTVQQAKTHLSRLMKEAEEGHEVVIARGTKPSVRLVPVEEPVRKKRIPGQYAGQFQYSDDIFKPLETDEELREYGFDILVDAKLVDREKPDERVA